jgi:hypothetical protein
VTAPQDDKLGRAGRALAEFFARKSGGQFSFRLWNGESVSVAAADG